MQAVSDNLARVRERIAAAAQRSGREAADITLVGVTKYVSAAATAALAGSGCLDLGESRPQQLWEKAASDELQSLGARWHLVGHLQRNKVARTVPLVSLVHSVDSPRLLKAIDATAADCGKPQRVLLEVNTSGDEAKHGFSPDGLEELVATLGDYPHTEVRGLMTMAAGDRRLQSAAANFAALRILREELASGGLDLPELSMGMSGDFEVAIAEGATLVRVGSALWEGVE